VAHSSRAAKALFKPGTLSQTPQTREGRGRGEGEGEGEEEMQGGEAQGKES